MKRTGLLFLMVLALQSTRAEEYKFTDLTTGLDTPWEILWGPDDHIWMTERSGIVSRVDPATGEKTELLTVGEVFEDGERGLMGMVLHPAFPETPWVYIAYNYLIPGNESQNERSRIRISRYVYDGTTLTDPSVIMQDIKGWWNHDGCRLWIDGDMMLWATIGDAAQSELAQDINSKNGKILRMNIDGTAPTDNPFAGALQGDEYVWSYGHRNPQGLVFAKGKIYSSEHGLNMADEVNIIEKGRNYGWPDVEGFCNDDEMNFCNDNNVKEPLAEFEETRTYAVAGIDYYDHELMPELKNSLIMASLKDRRLTVIELNTEGDAVTESYDVLNGSTNGYRLRDVAISPGGKIYIATSECDGRGDCPGGKADKIMVMEPLSTGIEEKNGVSPEVKVMPNPADGRFIIRSSSAIDKIEIYGVSGQLIKTIAIPAGSTEISSEIFESGAYYIKVSSGQATSVAPLHIIR